MFLCCFNEIRSQSLTQTVHERDSWLPFFRDVVVVQLLVCSNLVIQSVLKKICSESGEHLQS